MNGSVRRPRWVWLYIGVAGALAGALLGHVAFPEPRVGRLVDAWAGLAMFAWLFGWIRANRKPLRRLEHFTDASATTVPLRLVQPPPASTPARSACDDAEHRALLPYDFR